MLFFRRFICAFAETLVEHLSDKVHTIDGTLLSKKPNLMIRPADNGVISHLVLKLEFNQSLPLEGVI